jgi:toxin ParE1/3/4
MALVVRTPLAEKDLISIWQYIGVEKHDPDAADHVLDELEKLIHTLSESPDMGTQAEQFGSPHLKMFPKWSYVLFYQTIDEGIRLIRVLHGAQDIGAIL